MSHRPIENGATSRDLLHRMLRRTTHATLQLLYRLKATGLENVPREGPAVLISNHPSYFDPAAIYASLFPRRRVHFMAWERLWRVPAVAWVLDRYDAFPVKLDGTDRDSYRQAARLLDQGEIIGIFPEGGRGWEDEFRPTKRGGVRLAIRHRAPILPVAVSGGRRIWPRQSRYPRLHGRLAIQVFPIIQPPPPAHTPAEKSAQEDLLLARLATLINGVLERNGDVYPRQGRA